MSTSALRNVEPNASASGPTIAARALVGRCWRVAIPPEREPEARPPRIAPRLLVIADARIKTLREVTGRRPPALRPRRPDLLLNLPTVRESVLRVPHGPPRPLDAEDVPKRADEPRVPAWPESSGDNWGHGRLPVRLRPKKRARFAGLLEPTRGLEPRTPSLRVTGGGSGCLRLVRFSVRVRVGLVRPHRVCGCIRGFHCPVTAHVGGSGAD